MNGLMGDSRKKCNHIYAGHVRFLSFIELNENRKCPALNDNCMQQASVRKKI